MFSARSARRAEVIPSLADNLAEAGLNGLGLDATLEMSRFGIYNLFGVTNSGDLFSDLSIIIT